MQLDEYQKLAARTINPSLSKEQVTSHALHEIASECGEIHGLYQKLYQGHSLSDQDLYLEIGDLLWGIAELCTVKGLSLERVAEANIRKLQKRYPDGFDADKSVNRIEYQKGDTMK